MFDKKEYNRRWRLKNKEKIRKQGKEYREKSHERIKAYLKENSERTSRRGKEYRKKNHEKINAYMKEYYLKNKEKLKEQSKQWKENNPEKIKTSGKKHRLKNKQKISERGKQYREKNSEKIKEAQRAYCKTEKSKKARRDYVKNKRIKDKKYKLNCIMRATVGHSLKGNKAGRHWEGLVGYTVEDLVKQLKSTLPQNYTWQDFLDRGKLHIDHIIPISAFEFDKPEDLQFKECWSLKNLRLLPAKKNIIKSNKIIEPFQLLLKI